MSSAASRGRLVKASAITAGIVRRRVSAVITATLLLPIYDCRYALAGAPLEMGAPVSARPRQHARGAWAPAFRPPEGDIAQWSANRYKGRLSKLRTRAVNDRSTAAGCRR